MNDMKAIEVVGDALNAIADRNIDSGGGDNCMDFWVTIGGVEYFITMRRSNNQQHADAMKSH